MEQSILSCTPLTILIMMKYIARLIVRAKSKAIEQLFVGIRFDDRNFDPCVFRFDRKVNISRRQCYGLLTIFIITVTTLYI